MHKCDFIKNFIKQKFIDNSIEKKIYIETINNVFNKNLDIELKGKFIINKISNSTLYINVSDNIYIYKFNFSYSKILHIIRKKTKYKIKKIKFEVESPLYPDMKKTHRSCILLSNKSLFYIKKIFSKNVKYS